MHGHRAHRDARRARARTSTARRAYLAIAAAVEVPPRRAPATARQARRLIRRDLVRVAA